MNCYSQLTSALHAIGVLKGFADVICANLLLSYTDIHSICVFAVLGDHQLTFGVISEILTMQLRYTMFTFFYSIRYIYILATTTLNNGVNC